MSDIKSGYSDHVRFLIQAPNSQALVLKEEPEGWNEDDIELARNKDYYGIFASFTNNLVFYDEAYDYVLNAYKLGGVNTDLIVSKFILRDVKQPNGETEVKFVERYRTYADFNTLALKNNGLTVKFNANELEDLIKSHETDEFEIERLTSIDNIPLLPMSLQSFNLQGRNLEGGGEQVIELENDIPGDEWKIVELSGEPYQRITVSRVGKEFLRTKITTQGPSLRHTLMAPDGYNEGDPASPDAINAMFFTDDQVLGTEVEISFNWNMVLRFENREPIIGDRSLFVRFHRYSWNGNNYDIVSEEDLLSITLPSDGRIGEPYTIKGSKTLTLGPTEGIGFHVEAGPEVRVYSNKCTINHQLTESYSVSNGVNFVFVHDVYDRLMQIITGDTGRFYSKFFGRKELGYVQDGQATRSGDIGGALIGFMSGYWIRLFDRQSEKYKAPVISLKDLGDSTRAVFNTGWGIETVNLKKRLRVEEKKYFFQDEVVIKLPQQITKADRKVSSDAFRSGVTLGYEKGGEYDDEYGLDEPNTRTSWVTPIRKSKNKLDFKSKVRADEYGIERTRRKPQALFPEDTTGGEEDNWFLDMIRDDFSAGGFRQAEPLDRLQELPTGINSPDTFRSMIFTPLRMLFRHGWDVRMGMEVYLDRFLTYANAVANSTLGMLFKGETTEYNENSDILVSDLERSKISEWDLEFEHPIDDDLIDLIYGTTPKEINGEIEDVPNYYFKFEYINEEGVIERGYLNNFKPQNGRNGKFNIWVANEKIGV